MAKNFEDMTEVDLAYQILTDSGKDNPIHYKDLILEILNKKNKLLQNEAAAISEVYTMINMDSRFQYKGEGKWGLSEWDPPEVKKRGAARAKIEKLDEE
ncbi:MAG: DNA-directed RNA polymerase subunit delta [Selenomonadaceae bacterium]|nr:DNA-directed RNA polymerase subunit delta [Selenomonadaceae bacterium]